MKRKVILSGALCMCMLSSSAFAANTTSATSTNSSAVSGNETAIVTYESTSSPTTATSSSAPYCTGTKGTIVSIETDGESPMIEVKTETVESLVLQIGGDTVFVDNQLGVLGSLSNLKVGDEIYAYTDPSGECTVSTFAILTNLGTGSIAQMHKIENVDFVDGRAKMKCDHGSVAINTASNTVFRPNHVNTSTDVQCLQQGTSFLAWYNAADLGLYGEVSATRVLPLPNYAAKQSTSNTPYYTGTRAIVSSMETSQSPMMLEVQTDETPSLVLQIDNDTALIDNQLGTPVSISDIKVGDEIYAYTDPSGDCTVSTFAILTNLGNSAIAQMHKAENVNLSDGNATASCDHNSAVIRTTANTEYKSYPAKSNVSAQDVRASRAFLAWYSSVTDGTQKQATASRIVILPDYSVEPSATSTQSTSSVKATSSASTQTSSASTQVTPSTQSSDTIILRIGNTEIPAKKKGDSYQVPVRTVSEALGLTVDWFKEGTAGFLFVRNNSGLLSMAIGKNEYSYLPSMAGSNASMKTLAVAPHYDTDDNGVTSTWIDLDAFEMMGFQITD